MTFKTLLSAALLCTVATLAHADKDENYSDASIIDKLPAIDQIVEVSESAASAPIFIYNNPRRTTVPSGNSYAIWINSLNGDKFCEEQGHNTMVAGGTIACGEDESGYANYDFSSRNWVYLRTGSANRCYPLFASIYCR